MNLLHNIFKNMGRRPATRLYPAERRAAMPGARGHLVNNVSECIFCGMCQRRCPANALAVTRDPKTWTLDPYRCIICGYCVEVCPKKCLSLEREHRPPAPG